MLSPSEVAVIRLKNGCGPSTSHGGARGDTRSLDSRAGFVAHARSIELRLDGGEIDGTVK
jgi:hypothetical protein